jgi:hypothetical protein
MLHGMRAASMMDDMAGNELSNGIPASLFVYKQLHEKRNIFYRVCCSRRSILFYVDNQR